MTNKLIERLEIRLTKKMKKSIKRLSKRFDVSFGEVLRMGLIALEDKENAENKSRKQVLP